ncbi:MAG: T9SS type A sorting domain-containing protein, partial [Bacteroidetes bacterium]
MRIFLLILFFTFSFQVFSQNLQTNSPGWNNQFTEESSLSLELRVYPNPSTDGKVTVELNNQEISEVRLTNITGKEVFLKKFPLAENKKEIQLSDIPNGLYI